MAGIAGMAGGAVGVHDGRCSLVADYRSVGVGCIGLSAWRDNPNQCKSQHSHNNQYPGTVDIPVPQVEIMPCKGGNESDGGENSPAMGVAIE